MSAGGPSSALKGTQVTRVVHSYTTVDDGWVRSTFHRFDNVYMKFHTSAVTIFPNSCGNGVTICNLLLRGTVPCHNNTLLLPFKVANTDNVRKKFHAYCGIRLRSRYLPFLSLAILCLIESQSKLPVRCRRLIVTNLSLRSTIPKLAANNGNSHSSDSTTNLNCVGQLARHMDKLASSSSTLNRRFFDMSDPQSSRDLIKLATYASLSKNGISEASECNKPSVWRWHHACCITYNTSELLHVKLHVSQIKISDSPHSRERKMHTCPLSHQDWMILRTRQKK